MSSLSPVLSSPDGSEVLNLGESTLVRRVRSDQTNGAFSVVEFVSQPGKGVGPHVHSEEDELVYLLEGTIEVTLADKTLTVEAGSCALLPKGIPHGYVNVGKKPSRLLAVLMPGALDNFFAELDQELARDRDHEAAITVLCKRFGLSFLENASK